MRDASRHGPSPLAYWSESIAHTRSLLLATVSPASPRSTVTLAMSAPGTESTSWSTLRCSTRPMFFLGGQHLRQLRQVVGGLIEAPDILLRRRRLIFL